mgnify:CR=1 FL=1
MAKSIIQKYRSGNDWIEVYPVTNSNNVVDNNGQPILINHLNNVSNPHEVTQAQVGLSNVDNTADINKNVLSATKLTIPRTITLNGDQTGSVEFDGSDNVTLTTSNVVNNLLADLKTVDGSGSGLDADLFDGKDSVEYYQKSNILGIVSQLNNIPTGALIENGTNANGTYIRFADGTQICYWRNPTLLTPVDRIAFGRNTEALNIIDTWVYPATFISIPIVIVSAESHGSGVNMASVDGNPGLTTLTYNLYGPRTDCRFVGLAIGRWF